MQWASLGFSLVVLLLSSLTAQNGDYRVEAAVDNPNPFLGQQIRYTCRFYSAITLSANTLPLCELPDFEGFWRVDRSPVEPYVQTVDGRQYIVLESQVALYPTRPGDILIAPATVVLPGTIYQSSQEIQSNSVIVQVQPLPEGAPEGFTGAVGQFELAATMDRLSAPVGEPIILKVNISGTGNVEQLPLPELELAPEWSVYPNPTAFRATEVEGQVMGENQYELVLIPAQEGAFTLPAVSLAYFDPLASAYRTISTQPVMLNVLPSANATPSSLTATQTPELAALPLKPIPAILSSLPPDVGMGFWLLWLLPPLGVLLIWGWSQYQKRQQRLRVFIRQSQALKEAKARLDRVEKLQPKEAYAQIAVTILNYFADHLDRQPGDFDQAVLEQVLDQHGVNARVGRAVLSCLEWADEGRFAPDGAVDVSALVKGTTEALTRLDAVWKTS